MNKLRTLVIHESFLLYFFPKIVATLEEAEAPCYVKNASDSVSSKSQMLPNSLPLPAFFSKCFRFHKNFNRFRFHFHIPGHVAFGFTI